MTAVKRIFDLTHSPCRSALLCLQGLICGCTRSLPGLLLHALSRCEGPMSRSGAWLRSGHSRSHWLSDGHPDGAAMPTGVQLKPRIESDVRQSQGSMPYESTAWSTRIVVMRATGTQPVGCGVALGHGGSRHAHSIHVRRMIGCPLAMPNIWSASLESIFDIIVWLKSRSTPDRGGQLRFGYDQLSGKFLQPATSGHSPTAAIRIDTLRSPQQRQSMNNDQIGRYCGRRS